jgi:hypothetical protein
MHRRELVCTPIASGTAFHWTLVEQIVLQIMSTCAPWDAAAIVLRNKWR